MPVTEASQLDEDPKYNTEIDEARNNIDGGTIFSDEEPEAAYMKRMYLDIHPRRETDNVDVIKFIHKRLEENSVKYNNGMLKDSDGKQKNQDQIRRAAKKKANDKKLSNTLKNTYVLDYFDRVLPNRSKIPKFLNTYLRLNAKYVGEQQSAKGRYRVQVEFKNINLENSIITGFLQISGLTEQPEITTCFRGEIINNPLNKYDWLSNVDFPFEDVPIKKFSFLTENKNWGSFKGNDLDHWDRLTSTASSEKQLKRRLHNIQTGQENNDFIYMRWKEEFLLPDASVKLINGASFEGFYYVMLNIGSSLNDPNTACDYSKMTPGSIRGLYYHKTSEKFQSLSLRYVEDRGTSNSFNFA